MAGWDHALLWLPLWNTVVLLSSSVTVHIAHLYLKAGKKQDLFLGITVALALIFVGLQALEYYEACSLRTNFECRHLWVHFLYAHGLSWISCNDGRVHASSHVQ